MNTKSAVRFQLLWLNHDVCRCVCITRPPSSVRCNKHGAIAAAFQDISFVASTNGAFVRVHVCESLCVILNTIWTFATRTRSDFLIRSRSTDTLNATGQHSEPHMGSYISYGVYEGTPQLLFLLFNLRHDSSTGTSSQPHTEGEPCILYDTAKRCSSIVGGRLASRFWGSGCSRSFNLNK